MKTSTSRFSRSAFRIALIVASVATLGILVWAYLQFGDALVGRIAVTNEAQILSTLDLGKLERLNEQMQNRLRQPYLVETANPFSEPQTQPLAPAPIQ